jgi:hypothetical protein
MLKEVLVINADGTQEIVQQELPDNWDDIAVGVEVPTAEDRLAALEEAMLGLLGG